MGVSVMQKTLILRSCKTLKHIKILRIQRVNNITPKGHTPQLRRTKATMLAGDLRNTDPSQAAHSKLHVIITISINQKGL
jgi:hypothetical protein